MTQQGKVTALARGPFAPNPDLGYNPTMRCVRAPLSAVRRRRQSARQYLEPADHDQREEWTAASLLRLLAEPDVLTRLTLKMLGLDRGLPAGAGSSGEGWVIEELCGPTTSLRGRTLLLVRGYANDWFRVSPVPVRPGEGP